MGVSRASDVLVVDGEPAAEEEDSTRWFHKYDQKSLRAMAFHYNYYYYYNYNDMRVSKNFFRFIWTPIVGQARPSSGKQHHNLMQSLSQWVSQSNVTKLVIGIHPVRIYQVCLIVQCSGVRIGK